MAKPDPTGHLASSSLDAPISQAWADYRMLAVTAYVAAAVTAAFSGQLPGEDVTRAGLDRGAQAVQDLDLFVELRRRLG